jgi:signal transduction histidine kinase
MSVESEASNAERSWVRACTRGSAASCGDAPSNALIDSLPICVWAAASDGEIRRCSRIWHEYAGPDVGVHFMGAVPDDERDELGRSYADAIRRARPMDWEQRLRRRDGALRWHLCRMLPELDRGGEPTGWLITATDIDAQKGMQAAYESRLARETELRNIAEGASRAKDQLVATLSHELRTPLSSILGWTSVLRQGAASEAAMDRALRSIERSVHAQAKLLEDVLDVARAVAGKLSIEKRPFDVHQVVRDAVDGMQPEADAEGITLEASLAPGSGELVGDPDRLRQVVWNLLANAVKFTLRGGRVTVHVWREGSEIAIEVSDTGIGVAPDLLPHVFDRFRQGDSGTKGRRGLGLGLAIARDVVELHGGSVRASSAGRGKGATFMVRLPAGASAEPRARAGPIFARNGSPLEGPDQGAYTNV